MFTKTEIELAQPVYEAIKRIAKANGKKWEWEPEVGDWFLVGEEIGVVIDEDKVNPLTFQGRCIHPDAKKNIINWFYIHQVVPILHWETIEKILWDDYIFGVRRVYVYATRTNAKYMCVISERDAVNEGVRGKGRTRQEAVMRAIIKLGEEKGGIGK